MVERPHIQQCRRAYQHTFTLQTNMSTQESPVTVTLLLRGSHFTLLNQVHVNEINQAANAVHELNQAANAVHEINQASFKNESLSEQAKQETSNLSTKRKIDIKNGSAFRKKIKTQSNSNASEKHTIVTDNKISYASSGAYSAKESNVNLVFNSKRSHPMK